MRKRIVESYQRERLERERVKRLVALLAEGVHIHLRKQALLRGQRARRNTGSSSVSPRRMDG